MAQMIYSVEQNDIEVVRESFLKSLDARVSAESSRGTLTNSKLDLFTTFAGQLSRSDSYALGYLHHFPLVIDSCFTRSKTSGSMFDSKTCDLILFTATALNGGTLPNTQSGKREYLRGYVLALGMGERMATKLNDKLERHMQRYNAGWHQGARWGTACRGVLEAFGIIAKSHKIGNCDVLEVKRPDAMQRLIDAANGIYSDKEYETKSQAFDMPSDTSDADMHTMPDSIIIDGECIDISDLRALSAPMLALPSPATEGTQEGTQEGTAVDAPLALPAPANAPKARKARTKRAVA